MTELLHIAERAAWADGLAAGEYRTSTRGVTLEQEGFIHCSLPHQLRGVAERYYAGAEEYPHIYGAAPPGAVTRVIDVGRDVRGRLILPYG